MTFSKQILSFSFKFVVVFLPLKGGFHYEDHTLRPNHLDRRRVHLRSSNFSLFIRTVRAADVGGLSHVS
jgi:hypothetical protein